jgi:hypothetical protein
MEQVLIFSMIIGLDLAHMSRSLKEVIKQYLFMINETTKYTQHNLILEEVGLLLFILINEVNMQVELDKKL